jgi:hypothetical protein
MILEKINIVGPRVPRRYSLRAPFYSATLVAVVLGLVGHAAR